MADVYSGTKTAEVGESYRSDDTQFDIVASTNGQAMLKRNLSRRHINMIGLAGMIVCSRPLDTGLNCSHSRTRVLACS